MVWIVQTETGAPALNQNLKLWQGRANIASRGKKYVENRIGQSEHWGAPSRPVFFPGSSNMVADVLELACISLYVQSESESGRQFCSGRGENGRTQHQFLGTRNIFKKDRAYNVSTYTWMRTQALRGSY
jgi:hypothetical protein